MAFVAFEEDGKIRFVAKIRLLGDPEEPWNPLRTEVEVDTLGKGEVKAYLLDDMKEVPIEDGKFIILPQKPPKIALPEFVEKPRRRNLPTHVAYIAPVGVQCGIASYTQWLVDAVNRVFPAKVYRAIYEVEAVENAIIHPQIEFGTFPYADELVGKRIENCFKVATWHTIMREPWGVIDYYRAIDEDYDAHIVHSDLAKKFASMYLRKPIYVVPHGSLIWNPLPRDEARRRLGLPLDKKIVFCFGFASETKGFDEVIEVAEKMRGVLFVISAAIHGVATEYTQEVASRLKKRARDNVLVLGRYLSEEEINLYASACDCLLFNYKTPSWVSSASGALHRVLAAGKPIVASFDNRMVDLEDGVHALKFRRGDLDALMSCLWLVLEDREMAERLGRNARRLAEETSWDKVAQKHFKIYEELVGEVFGVDWYEEEYFVGRRGGKAYLVGDEVRRWSYFNPEGEWLGAEPIMKAIKEVLQPKTMVSVGEGRGTFVAYARKVGIEAVGIDFSSWAVRHQYKNAKDLVFQADARKLPFRDRCADLVFCSDIMEHIYIDDLDEVVSEVKRVAKKWVFYNIGSAEEEGVHYVLRRGELPKKEYIANAIAGHVTVMPCSWWREKVGGDGWRLRDDLVEEFRKRVVPKEALKNWICIIIAERVKDGED